MPTPVPLRLYGAVSRILSPFAYARTKRKLTEGGVAPDRIEERMGRATLPRPDGPLIWFHGASVGESLSILPLIEGLVGRAKVLVTTGTATSAALLAKRLPAGAIHQFAPLDAPGAAHAFLGHWRPDLAAFVESEVWPNILSRAHAGGVPLALINARMSARSVERWGKTPATARHLFGLFDLIVAQDARTRDGLAGFLPDTSRLSLGGNMKPAAAPLPHDPAALEVWQSRLGKRSRWVASSTHDGEDGAVLDAHKAVLKVHPEALLILAPRHPERGADIAKLAAERDLTTARLGAGETAGPETQVLVADTIGDLGLWYRLAPIVFLAGSFGSAGGHNPWETVRLGAALVHGTNVPNAAADYAELAAAGAAVQVADGLALGAEVSALLSDPARLSVIQTAANAASRGADDLVKQVTTRLTALLDRP